MIYYRLSPEPYLYRHLLSAARCAVSKHKTAADLEAEDCGYDRPAYAHEREQFQRLLDEVSGAG